jgi:hypothetical protein
VKLNSKETKGFNIRYEAVKLLDENLKEMLHDISLGKDLLDMTPKQQNKKIDKWDFNKLKNFCTAKETVNRVKQELMD